MKRIHLFEFEDLPWFPNFLRMGMTRCIIVFHRLVGTREAFAALLKRALTHTGTRQIIDLCSGSGGIMPEILEQLRSEKELADVQLTLTDLYPNPNAAKQFNNQPEAGITYETQSVDATKVGDDRQGLRTMVASFHHMKPELAQKILEDAQNSHQPYCMIDPGDNKPPTLLGFLGIPFVFLSCLLITPFVRPLTFTQLIFTYPIPLIPLFYAWDGAISGMRIYSEKDLKILLGRLPQKDGYTWESGIVKGKVPMTYILGLPNS
ncbi:MAG: hypothetical protein AAFQ98_09895 [Bacteroidota bacterium]